MDTKNIGRNLGISAQVEAAKAQASKTRQHSESQSLDQNRPILPNDFAVNLSPEAKDMAVARQKALDIARGTDPIRSDRVATLKDMIAKGEYKIDAENIADGMLAEAIRDKLAEDGNQI